MFAKTGKIQTVFFALLLLCSGCGYSNPYLAAQSSGEDALDKISFHIIMWKNETGELGYQADIHKRLIYWFNKAPNWQIVQHAEQADYVVNGIVRSADFPGLSYDQFENVRELRAEIWFSYEVTDRTTDEPVLEHVNLVKRETFSVNDSATTTEGAKKEALGRIADDIADEIYIRLLHKLAERT